MAADDPDLDALRVRAAEYQHRPSERWPYEPPGPDVDPGTGVREPRRPHPITDDLAASPADDATRDDGADDVSLQHRAAGPGGAGR